jgi:hypothetical protein
MGAGARNRARRHIHVPTWIAAAWIALAPLALGCGSAPSDVEATASTSSPIYGGVEDDDAQANAAVVALTVDNGSGTVELCSGSLIAPNVVLTARHCVSVQVSTTVTCDQNGVSAAPPDFGADEALGYIKIFTGPTPSLGGMPAATAAAVFHPTGTTLCNLDLALVVLSAPITGVQPLHLRLDAPVSASESVRAVGYGQNDQSVPIGTRFRKDGISVLAVGSVVSASGTALGSNEFEVGESMCNGDSGGPAIDETTGAIVGIVSRGGACTDATGHVYTSLAGFSSVFTSAFAMAGGAPLLEGQGTPAGPPPSADAGTSTGPAPTSTGTSSSPPPSEGNGNDAPVNLRAGQGAGCSASGGAGGAGGRASDGAAFVTALLVLAASTRRKRATCAIRSSHGRLAFLSSAAVRATHR